MWDTEPYSSPPEPKVIGDHLRRRRLTLGLPQIEVAEILGVTECSIYNWENNRTHPHIKFMPAIIKFLGYLPYANISNMSLGEKIVVYRQSQSLSQEDLARKFGIDPATVARWEKGKGKPYTSLQDDIDMLFSACNP
ncbi:MAG: helix-turn-helix transcriptional regulator [Armatimonadota bacterium]